MLESSLAPKKRPETEQPVSVEQHKDLVDVPTYDDPAEAGNELVPLLGCGCCVCFADTDFPSCVGCRWGGDWCCCTIDTDLCRILCSEDYKCCNMKCPESNSELKTLPSDCCMCYSTTCHLGGCRTCCASICNCCCIDMRCALPTDTNKTVPFIFNCCGFTLWYNLSFPLSCNSTLGQLKIKYPKPCYGEKKIDDVSSSVSVPDTDAPKTSSVATRQLVGTPEQTPERANVEAIPLPL
jgi:hypothetical protein